MSKAEPIQPAESGRRRRFTAEQKRAFLDEAARTGNSISEVARRYGLAPSMMFQWRRAMDDATKKSLKANEKVVPESEVKKLKARIRDARASTGQEEPSGRDPGGGRRDRSRKKTDLARELVRRGRRVKAVAEALGVSRPHLSATSRQSSKARREYTCCDDAVLLERVRAVVKARPSYGYRRVTALLNREEPHHRGCCAVRAPGQG